MKRRAGQMAKEIGWDRATLVALAKGKLSADMMKPFGKDLWLNEEGQALLTAAAEAPEIVAKRYRCEVRRKAPNPRVVYCYPKELGRMVPVVVPKRLSKSLVGKTIGFEEIRDGRGEVKYRYVRL